MSGTGPEEDGAVPRLLHDDDLDDDSANDGPSGLAAHRLSVPPEAAGERLDRFLAAALGSAGLTRSRLQALIGQGALTADGATIVDASWRVKPGQVLALTVPEATDAVPAAQDIPLTIVYEDDDLIVLDKPAGLVVHPAAGSPDGTLVNALLHHCGDRLSGIGGVRRPGIVHRLDKDTSGLMVVAKTDRAHAGLSAQFADRSLSRTYHALVWGLPSPKQGEIDAPIGRHPVDRKRMAVVRGASGKPAITRYRTLKAWGLDLALVECKLLTGRTHQIRVHLTEAGHPLVGDPLYGRVRPARAKGLPRHLAERLLGFPRQALHAIAIEFIHPVTGARMQFAGALPSDLSGLLSSLESV